MEMSRACRAAGRGPLIFLGLLACLPATTAVAVTPVQQIIDMLGQMRTKGAAAMEDEKKLFATYTEWVSDRSTDLGFEIKTAKAEIEELIAFADKADSKAETLGREVSELEAELGQTTAAQKAATEQRATDHDEYVKSQQDYSESVDALQRAIQVLKAQAYDRPQAQALLQRLAKGTKGMRRVLAAFLEEGEHSEQQARGAPAVAAYEFQAGGVVGILEKLLEKFKSELADVETQESNQAHAYDLEVLHLGNMAARFSADRDEKAALKGETAAESAKAKDRLAATRNDLAEDEKLLAETKATFAAKQRTFEANQKVRAEELQALAEAVEIISSSSVAGSYEKHVKLAQLGARQVHPHRALSFLQETSRTATARAEARQRAAGLLRSRATRLHSEMLAAAAAGTTEGPFAKVIQMIEGLLAKLKEEASAEADHKAYCDEELQKNKLKREKQSAATARLRAEVEMLGAQIQEMAEAISTLSSEQAALTKSMSEATAARTKEKAQNEATVKDALEAQQALKQAIVLLREFYAAQGGEAEATALMQQRQAQVPALEAYKGLQGSKGGVVGMLEVIESDFLRLEAEVRASEGQAAEAYASFMEASKASKEEKHKLEFKLSLDKDQTEFEQGRVKKDLVMEEGELEAANSYYEKLKPSCVQVHVSYEERVARRKEEIEALQEAYKILDEGASVA
mmetsp:Transcript_129679/g.276665  ORF Transcript_129679/g.276665 Transcript_129679/m.276665 type:complete len:688 (+) Transcript_129679:59-2122(+)